MNDIAPIDEKGAVAAPVEQANPPILAVIQNLALRDDVPIDRLTQILEMQERIEDRQRAQAKEDREYAAKQAYMRAMAACQAEVPVVIKNSNNTYTSSKYADMDAISVQAMPVINKHGLAVSFQPAGMSGADELLIEWRISHEDGYERTGTAAFPLDAAGSQGKVNKTPLQARGSTFTYGRRYLLCMLFNISTGDDNDGNSQPKQEAPRISKEQFQKLSDLLNQLPDRNAGLDQLTNYFRVERLELLAEHDFTQALNGLKKRVNNVKSGGQ